jgi:hypothetical protein
VKTTTAAPKTQALMERPACKALEEHNYWYLLRDNILKLYIDPATLLLSD